METRNLKFFSFKKRKESAETDEVAGYFLPANRKLGSFMTHRPDIVWIDSGSKKDEILRIVSGHPEFSHFPVCSGTVDSVLGVLPVRVFLASLLEPVWPGLKQLVKKPVYLPETVTIARTLSMIEENGCRMAFIIDEYGGIEGLVTRSGLVNELLEEFSEEDGEEDPDIFRREDGSYLVGGQVRMDEILEIFALPDSDSDGHEFYTLAGYLLSVNGSIPKTGDRITAGDYTCEIVDMDGHRIDKVLITKTEGITKTGGSAEGKSALSDAAPSDGDAGTGDEPGK